MEYESDTTMKGLKVNWISELILKEKLKDNPNQMRIRELQLLWDNLPD
jgi:hypothetical protein|tara:strand:- start:140 stop:283 length:144 start_codon:yes stop_codon:yes gene_type:complete